MNPEKFHYYMDNQTALDENSLRELRDVIEEYPYFQNAHLLYLKNLFCTEKILFDTQVSHYQNTAYIPDRAIFYDLIRKKEEPPNRDNEIGEDKYEKTTKLAGIDWEKELAKQSGKTESNENHQKNNENQKLIENFIQKQPNIERNKSPSEEKRHLAKDSTKPKDDFITDTLAKIYVKQGYYEKAIEAYRKLSLKYPKKNTYFARQIEKIEQIIVEQKNNE